MIHVAFIQYTASYFVCATVLISLFEQCIISPLQGKIKTYIHQHILYPYIHQPALGQLAAASSYFLPKLMV